MDLNNLKITVKKITQDPNKKTHAYLDVEIVDTFLVIKGIHGIKTEKGYVVVLPRCTTSQSPKKKYSPLCFTNPEMQTKFFDKIRDFLNIISPIKNQDDSK